MATSTDNQMKALVQLLCVEESPTNLQLLRQKIIQIGTACVPLLEETLGRVDWRERDRITSVLQYIERERLERQFALWGKQGGGLEEGAFYLAQFCYPRLEITRYQRVLDQMANEVRSRMKSYRKAEKLIAILNHYLFHDLGFQGNTISYYDPDNSYLNRVIDQRTGIPITLSVMMILLAKRLNLPIVGVGLPGHFLARFEDRGREIYIDAFNRGQIMTKEDCQKFVKEAGYDQREDYFLTPAPAEILGRMMRNLIFVYNQQQETQKVEWLARYVQAISSAGVS